MTERHDIPDILGRIDTALEVATVDKVNGVETVTSTLNSQFARPLAEATGLSTIVVRSEQVDGEAAAMAAARSAMEAFLPGAVLADLEKDGE